MLPIDFLLLPHSLLFFVQKKISHVLSQVLALFLQQFPLFMILDQWREWHQIHEFVFAQQNPLCYNVGQWKNAWSLFAHLWSLNLRTRVYPDMRFTEDIFSFKQLPTKEKRLRSVYQNRKMLIFEPRGHSECIHAQRVWSTNSKGSRPFKNLSSL